MAAAARKPAKAPELDLADAALCLAELGNPARLAAYRILLAAGFEGLPVNEVRDQLDIPDSTLTHHLHRLRQAGLITQSREGRVIRCRVDFQRMDMLMRFMVSECCRGVTLQGSNTCSSPTCC
ncbi:MAG: ArsR/SmtB family transcription factor [Ferrovibrio sp.]|jgi:ArsR family transcriptional regulator